MAQENNSSNGKKAALDLGAVWAHGVSLLRSNAQLIGVLAGIFVLLPNAALQFTLPADDALQGPMNALLDPSTSEAMQEKAALALGELLAPFLMWAGVVLVITHIGYAGIVALVGGARPTVGQALSQALRVILPLVLAIIITVVALYLVLVLVQLILMPLGQTVAAFLGAILGALGVFYLTARLSVTLPVMVTEWELNPVKALWRSWKLSSNNPGNVFGFWMLVAVAWFVTFIMQMAVTILLASVPGPGSTATLIQGLIGGAFAMVWGSIYSTMGVAMLSALKGPDAETIAADFE